MRRNRAVGKQRLRRRFGTVFLGEGNAQAQNSCQAGYAKAPATGAPTLKAIIAQRSLGAWYFPPGPAVASWRRIAAALLRRQFLGIGVARCRRPGQFDERHDPPAGAVKLANDEALLLDVGQKTPCTAQR